MNKPPHCRRANVVTYPTSLDLPSSMPADSPPDHISILIHDVTILRTSIWWARNGRSCL